MKQRKYTILNHNRTAAKSRAKRFDFSARYMFSPALLTTNSFSSMTRTYLIAAGLSVTSLFSSCAENSTTPETTLLTQQQDLPRVPNRKTVFDSAGIHPAFLAFLEHRYGDQASPAGQLLHPYWHLMTSIDEYRSVVPCSTVLDESEGFNALFVERRQGRFFFTLIGGIPDTSIERQAAVLFPDSMAQLAKTIRETTEPGDALSAGLEPAGKRSPVNR